MNLLYFILGMVSYAVALPILDALAAVLVTALEIPKGKLSLAIAKINEKLSELGQEPEQHYCIGFQAPEPEEEYDEEEEDDNE